MRKPYERSGVVRCQRCLKYGHYTYECENGVAYRYRPSRTVMFKEKIKLQLNTDKGPKTVIKDGDYKRVYVEDRPSSDEYYEKHKKKKQYEKPQNSQYAYIQQTEPQQLVYPIELVSASKEAQAKLEHYLPKKQSQGEAAVGVPQPGKRVKAGSSSPSSSSSSDSSSSSSSSEDRKYKKANKKVKQ